MKERKIWRCSEWKTTEKWLFVTCIHDHFCVSVSFGIPNCLRNNKKIHFEIVLIHKQQSLYIDRETSFNPLQLNVAEISKQMSMWCDLDLFLEAFFSPISRKTSLISFLLYVTSSSSSSGHVQMSEQKSEPFHYKFCVKCFYLHDSKTKQFFFVFCLRLSRKTSNSLNTISFSLSSHHVYMFEQLFATFNGYCYVY